MKYMEQEFQEGNLESFRIDPQAIKIHGNISIFQYTYIGTYRPRGGWGTKDILLRHTPIWKKEAGEWKLIGVMIRD